MLPQIFKNLQDVAVDENGVKPVTIKISYFRNGDILFAQKHTILQKKQIKVLRDGTFKTAPKPFCNIIESFLQ